jgi:hypothetical protein
MFTLSLEGFRPRLPFLSVPAFSASDLCGLCVSAFSPLSSSCSGGSSDPFPRAFASAPSCCHPERSKGSAFFGHLASPRNTRKSICHCSQAAIPFRITFFAHPHHLTSIDSHSCKTQGRGLSSTTRPKPFPFFPQRVDMHRTGTAITPVILCVYSTFSGYPGGGGGTVNPDCLLPCFRSLPHKSHATELRSRLLRASPRTLRLCVILFPALLFNFQLSTVNFPLSP